MSGSANFVSPFALGNLLAPVDGVTHAAKFEIVLANNSAQIDIASIQQQMGYFQPQSYWIDNSLNDVAITISELVYGWQVVIPAGSSIWNNFPAVANGIFSLTSTGSATATLSFFDFPVLPSEIINNSTSIAPDVAVTNTVNVDIVGGSIITPLTYGDSSVTSTGASQTLVAANANRKYLLVGAPSSAPIWINFAGGTAGPNLTGCFQIQTGGFYESNLAVPSNAVTVYCATAGLIIPCTSG